MKSMSSVCLSLFLSLLLPCCLSFNVLLVPAPGHSHMRSLLVIGKKLVERGNHVYLLADTFSNKTFKPENRYGVEFVLYGENSTNFENFMKMSQEFFLKSLEGEVIELSELKKVMSQISTMLEEDMLVINEKMMAKLNEIKFDICVVDVFIILKLTVLLPHRLGIPFVVYTDTLDPWIVRTPWLPSIQPHEMLMLSPDYKHEQYSFWDRLYNTVMYVFLRSFNVIKYCSEETLEAYRKFGYFKDIDDLISRSLLYLTTDDAVVQASLPRTSNVVQVGGLTTELLSSSPLPSSYLSFIHRSNNTIIVSFGSQITKYPKERYVTFIEAFKKLPQFQIIWKAKHDPLVKTPANVLISDWIPQNDLLSQESVKVFVTHSGNNGLFETIVHGVPLVAMPVQADQFRNKARVVSRGFGVGLNVATFTSSQFVEAILEVTDNPRYKNNIMKASAIFKSAPQTPSERAAYWIEHVTEFGGDHLKPAGNELTFWQYLLLDVLLFLFVLALLQCVAQFVCMRYLVSFISRRRQAASKKKQ